MRRRRLPLALIIIASLVAFVGLFAVWANRQLLDTDNWTDTSTKLLEDDEIRGQLSTFLVDELYTNVDVKATIEEALPPRADPLAGPAAGALRDPAEQAVDELLQRPRPQAALGAAQPTGPHPLHPGARGRGRRGLDAERRPRPGHEVAADRDPGAGRHRGPRRGGASRRRRPADHRRVGPARVRAGPAPVAEDPGDRPRDPHAGPVRARHRAGQGLAPRGGAGVRLRPYRRRRGGLGGPLAGRRRRGRCPGQDRGGQAGGGRGLVDRHLAAGAGRRGHARLRGGDRPGRLARRADPRPLSRFAAGWRRGCASPPTPTADWPRSSCCCSPGTRCRRRGWCCR